MTARTQQPAQLGRQGDARAVLMFGQACSTPLTGAEVGCITNLAQDLQGEQRGEQRRQLGPDFEGAEPAQHELIQILSGLTSGGHHIRQLDNIVGQGKPLQVIARTPKRLYQFGAQEEQQLLAATRPNAQLNMAERLQHIDEAAS